MKKTTIILICVLAALASCTKSKEVHPEVGDCNDEIVTVGIKDVHVKYFRTDHEDIQNVVFFYGLNEAQQFETAVMTKRDTFFELMLNGLLSDTLYCYYYELFYNGGETIITDQKTFCTQALVTPIAPEGVINGLFTVNENGDQVYFSQGNLQYQASTNTWRFAEHQWERLEEENTNVSPTYEGWIDLFNWGTSGYNQEPTATSLGAQALTGQIIMPMGLKPVICMTKRAKQIGDTTLSQMVATKKTFGAH